MTPTKPCHYCGQMHETICPRIKRVMYDRGTVQSVEFWAPGELPKQQSSTPPLSSGEEE